ncbi:MAG: hypothetical protein ACOC8N_09805, partial [Spirochaetota bacterium]
VQQRAKRRAAGMTAPGAGRETPSAGRGEQQAGAGRPTRPEAAPDRSRAAVRGERFFPDERPGLSFLEEKNAATLFPRPEEGAREPGTQVTGAAARQRKRSERAQRARAARPAPARARPARAVYEEAGAAEQEERAEEAPAPVMPATGGYVSPPALRGDAWKRIQRLPPLKRAVVLSEVMGKPRGLEGGEPWTG